MAVVKHKKPDFFYDEFFRKGEGQKNTHFCPGCGHGNAHKLIAEVVSGLKVEDRTVICGPVGCGVFTYYYFDAGNFQCAHGRAPAVATGIRRTLADAIIIAYQGDGDLAGIGIGAIIHAANRGENISVFFVNNAIYGMTGGQMAPTSIIGQKTVTTPTGRSVENEGYPIGMSEMLNSLKAPVFIERVSLGDAPRILRARKAFHKAIENQVKQKGFSFVEVLSPCPINWKMSPVEASKWIIDSLEPVFPVKNFRDESDDRGPVVREEKTALTDSDYHSIFNLMPDDEAAVGQEKKSKSIEEQYIKIAGFGGQGVMSAGILLANCGLALGINSSWIPSYGPEMRGGTANASVILSSGKIGAPVVDAPNVLFAMNLPSLDAFEDKVVADGLILVDSSQVQRKVKRQDVEAIYIPATEIAQDIGLIAVANVIMLTVYILKSKIMDIEILQEMLPRSIKRKNLVAINIKAVAAGLEYFNGQLYSGSDPNSFPGKGE